MLEDLVGAFCLSVCLGVIRRGHGKASPQKFHESLPKLARKTWVTIGNENGWDTVQTNDVIGKELGGLLGGDVVVAREEVGHL